MLPQQQRRGDRGPEPACKTGRTENGEPYFKARPLIEAHNVAVFSSNYTLYASMSARFAAVVESLSSRVEQYSIDELFVDCRGMETAMNTEAFGHQLRREVQRHTTLTCGVGVSFTKTLAKLCNHAAKTLASHRGRGCPD